MIHSLPFLSILSILSILTLLSFLSHLRLVSRFLIHGVSRLGLLSLLFVSCLNSASAQEDRFAAGLAAKDRGHHATAIRAWLPLAEAGNAEAQNNIGFMYEEGLGVGQNYLLAMNWYRQAADSGLAQAQHNMGMLYHHGYGVAQNRSEAVRWFERAADQALAESEYMLGLAKQTGEGTPLDYGQARSLFLRAALQAYGPGQLMTAFMLQAGEGGEPDSYRAAVWARIALANGQVSAEDILVLAELQLDENQIAQASAEAAGCLEGDLADCAS